MDVTQIDLKQLFEQLGLGSSDREMEEFIKLHAPLASDVLLSNAEFWSDSQAEFLRAAVAEDAEWAIVVGQLDSLMR